MERSWTDQASYRKQHLPHHAQQAPAPPLHLQHPRPSSIVHQQQQQQHHPNSPHLSSAPQPSQHQNAFPSPHASHHPGPSPHQSAFTHTGAGAPAQHPQEIPYFPTHPSPYSTPSASGTYSSTDTPEMMATAHLNRPYPPIYHTPQSNSPASIASPSSHDQHGRSLYGQAPAPMPQGMYTYPPQNFPPMGPSGPSYGHQPAQQQQQQQQQQHQQQQPQPPPPQHPSLKSQAMLMSHQPGQPQLQHHMSHPHAQPPIASSPRQKLAQNPLQRPPSGPMGQSQHTPTGLPGSVSGLPPGQGQVGGSGVNPNAAPGPIPATTPLVVRQDNNGVQWIAFEYSRDRVKMEYTIRCDVESVNVDSLSPEFRTENCVYPRACCGKDQYRGNRLNYETECNTVGWALAELNVCLRGKRGLIQRAVDSWRNSNQDPRLRSRRVRRMAKINTRKAVQAQHQTHMAGPSGPSSAGIPGPGGMPGSGGMPPGSLKPGMGMGGPQLHHHHAHPDGSGPGGGEDVSAHGDYGHPPPLQRAPLPNSSAGGSPSDVRSRPIFHPYPSNYPADPGVVGASMAPPTYDPMDHLSGHVSSHTSAVATAAPRTDERNVELFGDLPEAKRRKFILVDDTHRGARVRVRVMLDQVEVKEIPDSYRRTNSVFPRSYFPMQTQSPSSSPTAHHFPNDADDQTDEATGRAVRGRTLVPVPLLDGSDVDLAVPRLGRTRRKREATLNELGYRMSWSQSRVFAGRTMFLQKALDAYRNKMHSSLTAAGLDVAAAPHFETRVGKRQWLGRTGGARRGSSP